VAQVVEREAVAEPAQPRESHAEAGHAVQRRPFRRLEHDALRGGRRGS
jgi:hypothetical protein